jgi:UPF0755 protein
MRKFSIVIILAAVIFVFVSLWWNNGLSAVDSHDKSQKFFVIPKGTAIRTVGNELKSQKLIKDPVVFFIYIKLNNLDHDIQAGSYRLSSSMSLPQIMETLGHGTVDIWVTIPEGLRSEEIAAILKESIPTYKPEWIERLSSEKGYLFPDTYLIPRDATIDSIITLLENNFYKKVMTVGLTKDSPHLNKIVTEASLIEREAKFEEDRPYVASVLENRLAIGMALQIDATVQYVTGYNQTTKKWWNQPAPYQLKVSSPYNTYINTGLPPAPICNPGLSAIQAAVNPKDTNYIYYVNDSKGKLHFAENLSDHNKNIQKYLN